MKKLLCFSIFAAFLSACQPATKSEPVDTAAATTEVNAVLDKFHNAFKSRDKVVFLNLLSDDGLYLGTDSREIMDKTSLSQQISINFADTSLVPKYTIDKREIRIGQDGNSCIAVDQFVFDLISPKIPCRQIFHLVKTGSEWKISFASWNLVPNNEDLGKINKSLE